VSTDTEVVVTAMLNSGMYALKVLPDQALVKNGDSLDWKFVLPSKTSGYTIEVDFGVYDNTKGPFPRLSGLPHNPNRGRYIGGDSTTFPPTITTQRSDHAGYWKYHVVLRDDHGDDVVALDPGLMVKD
jgi:hypothetical protein